ncbi:MAG TPA: translation initiation factor IF-2, partial [Gammaproteobacteria bacterium]|nr:translation initiation factor IF-2 [Gammaproteobacteria bacterium]
MSEVTVKQFAEVVGIPVDRLIAQLSDAGLSAKASDETITDDEKMTLLSYLRERHGKTEAESSPKRITLKRKMVSEIKGKTSQSGGIGQGKTTPRTISVEVRKKRTYVKRSETISDEDRALAKAASEAKIRQQREQEVAYEKTTEMAAKRAEKAKIEEQKAVEEKTQAAAVEVKASKQKKDKVKPKVEDTRTAEEVVRAQVEAVQVAEVREDKSTGKKKKRKGKSDTDHNRKELHVASDKSGRRKKKSKAGRGARSGVSSTTPQQHGFERPTAPIVYEVGIPETISVADLAQKMSVKAAEVIKVLMTLGTMATINQVLDQDTAFLIVEEMGHKPKRVNENALEDELIQNVKKGEKSPRSPVVTV